MTRAELGATLKRIEEAISLKEFIPAFTCFHFTSGGFVQAYDDVVGMRTRCALGVVGGLPGSDLMDALTALASEGDDMEVTPSPNEVKISCGAAWYTLPLTASSEFTFDFPNDPALILKLDDPKRFKEAMERAAISMSKDPSYPWRMGVTLVMVEGKGMVLYSSDDLSMTRVGHAQDPGLNFSFVLPPKFCELLLTKGLCSELKFGEGWVMAEFEDLTLYSRTIDDAQPDNFKKALRSITPSEVEAIPAGFEDTLRRASLPVRRLVRIEERKARIRNVDNSLYISADAKLKFGESCKGKFTLPMDVLCAPELLLRAAPYSKFMGVVDTAVYFQDDHEAFDFCHAVMTIKE